jgi:hypothetical protein
MVYCVAGGCFPVLARGPDFVVRERCVALRIEESDDPLRGRLVKQEQGVDPRRKGTSH